MRNILHKYFTSLAFFAAMICMGCKKEKEQSCISYTNADVVKVTAPSAAAVNQEVDITITYTVYNGCGKYLGLSASSSNNTTTISVKTKYEGCVCTAVFLSGNVIYKFKAAAPGKYYLQFPEGSPAGITDSITVN